VSTADDMRVEVNKENPLLSRTEGRSPALNVGIDMVRRGAVFAPIAILIGTLIWGTDGAASVALALGIVLVNVWLSAFIIDATSRISFAALAAGAMFGFLIRLGLITAVFLLVKDQGWLDVVAFGISLIISHLGLLFWELRYISASLAYPGLKPAKTSHKETITS